MTRQRIVVLAALTATLGLGLFLVEDRSDARPGGGRSYVAPSRSSSYRSSSSYRGSYRPSSSSGSTTYRAPTARTGGTVVVVTGSSSSGGGSYGSYSPRKSYVGMIVALVVLGLIIGFVIYIATRKKQRAKIEVDTGAQTRGIAALRNRDPSFDPGAFCERTKKTMARVNEAWLSGNMGPARRLISDGTFVRFQGQMAILKAQGLKNVMTDWRVVSADILAAEADARWDTVHVKVVGQARDFEAPYKATPEEVAKLGASAKLEEYHEVWSFLRRRGQQSKGGAPALEGRCPNCGADMPISDAVKCEYCSALVNSGEHDWVLAEITQPEEWSVDVAYEELDGFEELRQRDPNVSRQELEDRASVIFWKWAETRLTGETKNLTRFCVGNPKDPSTAAMLGLDRANMTLVTVGSSEVVDVLPGTEGGLDRAVIEIRWSAGIDQRPPVGFVHCFHLERAVGAQSKNGLSSLDCPNCRGNLPESDAAFCSYCGEPLAGGKHEWSLAQVQFIGQ